MTPLVKRSQLQKSCNTFFYDFRAIILIMQTIFDCV